MFISRERTMKKIFFAPIVILLLLTVCPCLAQAAGEESVVELAQVQVKASRTTFSQKDLPTSSTVISAEEIHLRQNMQVQEVLREQLGMDIVRSGPMGTTTSLKLRGAESESTIVLIDGVEVNDALFGGFNFTNLTTDNIERIEILRGPQGTIWGADAVGGVVNIVTKRGRGTPTHTLSFEGGSFGTFKESIASSGSFENFDYSLAFSKINSEGFSAANHKILTQAERDDQEKDGYESTTLSARLGYGFENDLRIEFTGRALLATAEFDDSNLSFIPSDNGNFSNTRSFSAALPIQKQITEMWNLKLTPKYADNRVFSFDPNEVNATIRSRNFSVELLNTFEVNERETIIIGGEFQWQSGTNVQLNLGKEVINQAFFIQLQESYLEDTFFSLGFRHDKNYTFGEKLTFKFEGAHYIFNKATRLHAAVATGFRAPTISNLFLPGFGGFPPSSNTALIPEEVISYEIGFDQSFLNKRLRLSLTYFNMDFKNKISFDFGTSKFENIGSALSEGIEGKITAQLTDHIDLSANYTWNDSINLDTNRRLRQIAKNKANVTLHYNPQNKFDALVSVHIHDDQVSTNSVKVGGYATVRSALNYQLDKHWKLTARGENLLNEDYEEVINLTAAGISGFVGFVYNF